MKRINIYSSILCLLVILFACEKEYAWDTKSDNADRLVVDGILTNENIEQCIKLSLSVQDLNMNDRPVSGAIIIVTSDMDSYEFFESREEPGSYYSSTFQAVVDKQYRLSIVYGEGEYEATAEGFSVTTMGNPVFSGNEEGTLFNYVYLEAVEAEMLEINYNWTEVSEYCFEYGNCFAQESFYTLDIVDVNEIFAPPKQIIWFPLGTIIIRKKYSLSKDHQEFIRSLLMETEWRGGIFDVQHGNVPANISNGALGCFAVCMVISDTLNVN